MKLIGLMPVRNEAWCLGLSARVALRWVDELVILEHASTDASMQIIQQLIHEHPERVIVLGESNPQWDEMRHRQWMLDQSREREATRIAIIDADEILTGSLLPNIRHHVENTPRGHILMLPGYNLRDGIHRYHSNGIWGNRWFATAFKDDPRLSWSGDKFHAREPVGLGVMPRYQPVQQGSDGVMHLWGASERRLKAKHALYKLNERLRWQDKPVGDIDEMYSWAIHGRRASHDVPARWNFTDVPYAWWKPYEHLVLDYLDMDAEPWQEQECRRLVCEYGKALTAGLDLFGVV